MCSVRLVFAVFLVGSWVLLMLVKNLFKYWTYKVFAPGEMLRSTYKSFQKLLDYDGRAHEDMAELESLYYLGIKEDLSRIRLRYERFSGNVLGMVESLEQMAPGAHVNLKSYYKKFDFYSKFLLAPPRLDDGPPFVCSLQEEGAQREDLVGGKASQLAILASEFDLSIPGGFIITANCCNFFMAQNDLRGPVDEILCDIKGVDPQSLIEASATLVDLIMAAAVPDAVREEISAAWDAFSASFDKIPLVAVRSSCLNEDGSCSFAGQYLTLLNVTGDSIVDAWHRVISSKYSPEALAYRLNSGLGDEETAMAVLVQEMVDARVSGVLYTADPARGDETRVSVHAVAGQGDALVSGRVVPESYETDEGDAGECTDTSILSHAELALLQKQGRCIADYFDSPRDVEWSITRQGALVILQCRPLWTQGSREDSKPIRPLAERGSLLFKGGVTAATGQACGPAYIVDSGNVLEDVPSGTILVLRETLPSAVCILRQVRGVVAELGSVAGHFSTVCREFGVPLLLAVGERVKVIEHGEEISLFADIQELWQGNCLPAEKHMAPYKVQASLPYFRRLRGLLKFITPLNLLDPESESFVPESCRSLHDIVRFSHEQAVQIMFSLGDRGDERSKGKRKLLSDLPLEVFLLDVGGGLEVQDAGRNDIYLEEVRSTPFRALWQGLSHSSVEWEGRSHFDWKAYDEIVLAGGVVSQDSSVFASFAVLGSNYVNLNMRFGYHFILVDAMCDEDAAKNYCQLRFAGGGGDFCGRSLRIDFVEAILTKSGFQVTSKGDLLDAKLQHVSLEEMLRKLEILGRLLGVTKLMDMRLRDESMVHEQMKTFWKQAAE